VIALARKYRPRTFAEVAVQTHVSNTLRGAIARRRVAHGYLLCGPRGVGKTTLARVLAMALNCERRIEAEARLRGGDDGASPETLARDAGEPCGVCVSCQRIWSGASSLDVVEIDAASNRGVDDARDLRERAMYAPSGEHRWKVYIIDEAHMLTREAWNALLKVLEEPPSHVTFVFATTEPQKIAQFAAPVLSRLQRFDLKRIGPADIRARLTSVLDAEGVTAAPDALAMIARAADGSMRDALSLTDQVLALGESEITVDRVREALGLVAEEEHLTMLDLVVDRRAGDVFGAVARLVAQGVDLSLFLAGFADLLRAQLATTLGGDPGDVSERLRAALSERKDRLAAGDLVRMLSALAELEPRFRRSTQQQLLLETLLVRFALLDRTVAIEDVLRELSADGGEGSSEPTRSAAGPRAVSRPPRVEDSKGRAGWESPASVPRLSDVAVERPMTPPAAGAASTGAGGSAPIAHADTVSTAARDSTPPAGATVADLNAVSAVWDDVVAALRRDRPFIASLLENAIPTAVASGTLTVHVESAAVQEGLQTRLADVVAAIKPRLPGLTRVLVRTNPDRAVAPDHARLTVGAVRSEMLAALRKRSAVLSAAIDSLDLDLAD
jgi:DNA polymerase-3 subunit gamma/tau